MIKLSYINQYGQVLKSDGSLLNAKIEKENFEIYDDIEEAKKVAESFVKKLPLMGCIIIHDDKEIIITADEESYKKAKIENDLLLEEKLKKLNRKSFFYDLKVYGLIILVIALFYFIFS